MNRGERIRVVGVWYREHFLRRREQKLDPPVDVQDSQSDEPADEMVFARLDQFVLETVLLPGRIQKLFSSRSGVVRLLLFGARDIPVGLHLFWRVERFRGALD